MREIDFSFSRREPVKKRLNRIVAALSAHALFKTPGGRKQDEQVHHVRTSIKKLRAVWRLVRPVVAGEHYDESNQFLRDAAQGLAPWRDGTAAISEIEELLKRSNRKSVRVSCARALETIVTQNVKHSPAPALLREKIEHAAKALRQSQQNFSALDLGDDDWVLIGAGLKRVYRSARKRMKAARKGNSDQEFHDWRKSVKYFMYHTQLLEKSWPKHLEDESRRLKKLEQTLGEDHDLTLLANFLNHHRSKLARGALTHVLDDIQCCKERLRRKSLKAGKKLFAKKPGKVCSRLKRHWQKWRE